MDAKLLWILDKHNGIMDINNWNMDMWIPELWISIDNFMHKYECPWIHNWIMDNHID